jgi:hypothetical protein
VSIERKYVQRMMGKESRTLSGGRPARRHMMFRYRKEPEAFFSNVKRRFGPSVKSRIGAMRRREVWMRILNMLAVASEEVERELKVAC